MEENTSTKESKLTYEQLEQVAMQLQQKLAIAESKLRTIDFASMRLTWLFRVIENKKGCFSAVFISKCVKEIEDILTLEENTTENKEQ